MRTLLRHALTGQYYRSEGKWTANKAQAYDFMLVGRAIKFVRRMHSPNMEVDLSFDNPQDAAAFRLKELFKDI